MFERLLSANLAGKFISCWHELKQLTEDDPNFNSKTQINPINIMVNGNGYLNRNNANNGQYYVFDKHDYAVESGRDYEANEEYTHHNQAMLREKQNEYKKREASQMRSPKDILNLQNLKESHHRSEKEGSPYSNKNYVRGVDRSSRNNQSYRGDYIAHDIDRD